MLPYWWITNKDIRNYFIRRALIKISDGPSTAFRDVLGIPFTIPGRRGAQWQSQMHIVHTGPARHILNTMLMTAEEKSPSTEQIVSIYRWITVDSLLVMRSGASFYGDPTCPFLFTFSLLISSLIYFFPLRIDPLSFQAGCRNGRLNMALVFLCLSCVVAHFFWSVNACFCCVRFSFLLYTEPTDWLGERWVRRRV